MSLQATQSLNWRSQNPNFDKNMVRPKEYGALDFFVMQTNSANSILPQDIKDMAFRSIGNTVQFTVLNHDSEIEVSNIRTCVIQDAENTSALYTVNFATYSVGFTMVPSAFVNNDIAYDRDFNRKYERVARALANALDKGAIAALDSQKTQVFKDKLNYVVTGNVMQIPTQMASEVLGDINPIMRANEYTGQIHLVGNAGVDSLIRKLSEHDVYNDVNKRLEYQDKVLHYTTNILNEDGKNGTFYAVEDGNVGILTRVDAESLSQSTSGVHQWDVVNMPFLNLPVGSHYYEAVGDQSDTNGPASAHATCSIKQYFGFSIDVAFITAYNSDPSVVPNPIIKAEISARAENAPMGMPVYIANDETSPIITQTV